jgi:hypothetical protein
MRHLPNTLKTILALILNFSLVLSGCRTEGGRPEAEFPGTVRLCPGNPRYLEYQGEPVVLITSAEHYGAVLNLDFDYQPYLETLEKEGFNYTRIFSGTYLEPVDNIFGIQKNTLAPVPGRYMAPWDTVGGKYDLERFNPAYFERLKDFVATAAGHGIIVEVTLFSSIYAESAWTRCPFHAGNNVNGVGDVDFRRVNTLYNGGILAYQESFVRKMVRELNGFDNVFFEIQNEPWSDNPNLAGFVNEGDKEVLNREWQKKVEIANGVSLQWQARMATVIRDEEERLPKSHLVDQNISNFQYDLDSLPEGVSMVNFHYALPEAVLSNLDLGGTVCLDETGFMPHQDALYLDQAWRFLLSGGGLYNNLDYSFTAGNERGDWPIPDTNPGWGGPVFRKKLSLLAETLGQAPFHEMDVSTRLFETGASGVKQYALEKRGEICLAFLEHITGVELVPLVPPGDYVVTFIQVDTGEKRTETLTLGKGQAITSPYADHRVAILIRNPKSRPI